MNLIKKKKLYFVLITILSLTIFVSCKGGIKCGPGEDPLTDADSDCIEDTSDNCPLDYNPDQVDIDEDNAGLSCDIDDDDETVGPDYSVSETSLTLTTHYLVPEALPTAHENRFLNDPECLYFLVGCGDQYLGALDNDQDMFELFDSTNFFSRPLSSCSALNEFSEYPPMIFCDDGQNTFVGYLTINPHIANGIDTCHLLADLGIFHPLCQ